MASYRDAERFRKIYSYYRPRPRPFDTIDVAATFQGWDWKQSVRVASDTNVDLTATHSDVSSVDTGLVSSLADEDRVLLKNQTSSAENGIYIWYYSTQKFERSLDAVQDTLTCGAATYIDEGTYAGAVWALSTNDPIAVGTTAQTWTQLIAPGGGGGTTEPVYFVSTVSGSLYTTGSVAFSSGFNEASLNASSKGTDVFFYVSGTISGSGSSDKKALFGGDVRISGSFAQGDFNASGKGTIGKWSHAEGFNTIASGSYSHAEGNLTIASGDDSHAEGGGTTASGIRSHAEGKSTVASGPESHAEGGYTTASNTRSHAEGSNTTASGYASHAEGKLTTASGYASHAEGGDPSTTGPQATGDYSHAEGYGPSTASGTGAHAEGESTTASGNSAHAEGGYTAAVGNYSHAEGQNTVAFGVGSHAAGLYTIASGTNQNVVGKYNLRGNDYSLFVVGNGVADDDSSRSDILRVNTSDVQITGSLIVSQNITVSGDVTVNGSTTTINTTNLEVKDAVIGLGFSSGTIASTAGDRGIIGGIAGSDNVAILWKNSVGEFSFGRTTYSATGSLPISLSNYTNIHVANVQASIVTASSGFSGSLTKLSDGTSYLIAGNNVSIVSSSNGSITVNNNVPVYFVSTNTGSLYTTGSVAFSGGGSEVGQNTLNKGSDVFFYVSGSTNGTSKALFGGNIVTSGSVLPGIDSAQNLGSSTNRWANVYTGDLHLKNDRGDWTVIEEEDYLTLRNNKTGKRFKLMMELIND